MIENWKKAVDNKGVFGALLTDLSKAFDCLRHDLIIAKLNAYRVNDDALNLVISYFTKRKQRVKIENAYSSWNEIKSGVPQGSILGPLIFNIFIADLFLAMPNVNFASYADDNTPYAEGDSVNNVITSLEDIASKLFIWFENNCMKANPEKCHMLLSSDTDKKAKISSSFIKNSKTEKLLGITIDNKLRFEDHVNNMCKKASQKLNALARISTYMKLEKKSTI